MNLDSITTVESQEFYEAIEQNIEGTKVMGHFIVFEHNGNLLISSGDSLCLVIPLSGS